MKQVIDAFITDLSALGGLPLYSIVTLVFLLRDVNTGLKLIASLILAFAITAIIRIVYFKTRPKKRLARNFLQKLDASSFPSLHTMRATILAVLLATSEEMLFVLLTISALVGYARYKLKHHYLTDVTGGYIIGFIIAITIENI